MNLVWLVNRLRSMSPAEVVWRVREQALRRLAKGRLDRWGRYEPSGSRAPQLPGLLASVQRAEPQLRSAIQAAAERILSGHFSALGVTWPKLCWDGGFPANVWRLDPVTGKNWPGADTFTFDIGYRHAKDYGDIKYAWEYQRLQFLQPVAAHYALTKDGRALAFIEAAIESWFAHNPPYHGIGWNSGIELALRSISLLIVSSCCEADLSLDTQSRIRRILVSHLAWMRRFPSGYSSANNHLIAECAAEFLVALCMPELPISALTLEKAGRTLELEADKQILRDGVGAEQSPTYGAFTAEFLLLCAEMARRANRPLDGNVDKSLARFAKFISWVTLPDATTPQIGDDDEGRVITLTEGENCYPASVSACIWGYLGMEPEGVVPARNTLRDAIFSSQDAGGALPKGVRVFEAGGYSVFRGEIANRNAFLLFDHGPLGYLSIAAHGHADALAWILCLNDQPVLVDPGTYLYHSGGPWRDWFRGTAAHNTLRLGARDQSIISGPFNWSHKANARLLDWAGDGKPDFEASHDGYLEQFGVVHRRRLIIGPSSIRVKDRLVGERMPPLVEMSYQLAPNLRARIEDNAVLVWAEDDQLLRITFPDSGSLSIAEGEGPDRGGWVSRKFGTKTPAPRIIWTTTNFPAEAATEFHML
ncbi:heparinase II/III family protein [Rhizobium oryzicola]|uniref:Alginate lyase family protein n=1 Tax=Rhizobium oryzicola TaxID=1232668 RepID=A0ABT8SWI9_9HYPH|nr:alginate lyase family protein [Rhizobium oryzicola]MDO1582792.1 alginate lyase family protein [Rhizobium oryzicola]